MREGLTTRERMIVNYHTFSMVVSYVKAVRGAEQMLGRPITLSVDALREAALSAFASDEVQMPGTALPEEAALAFDILTERGRMSLALAEAAEATGRNYLTSADLMNVIRFYEPVMEPIEMFLATKREIHLWESDHGQSG